eukprot:gb/GEZJ01003365.1/.p4 GENE.gb/GEZJ01003365.1/~~gb/GEZJ01003365.1/.p4  ORF type:complete len:138 (-),score=22.92 gb/GEZJ01003365.1/:1108-1521(-)
MNLRLAQEEIQRLGKEVRDHQLHTQSFWQAVKNKEGKSNIMERGGRMRHEIEVDERLYGVAKNMYDSVLQYVKSEMSELFLSEAVARNWVNKCEVLGEERKESVMVMDGKEIVLRCPVEVAREMKPYSSSVKGGSEA